MYGHCVLVFVINLWSGRKENLKHSCRQRLHNCGGEQELNCKPEVRSPTHRTNMIISASSTLQLLWATPKVISLWTHLPWRPTNSTTWMEARKGTENICLAWRASCQICPNKHLISLPTLSCILVFMSQWKDYFEHTNLFCPPTWAWKWGRVWVLQM